MRKRKIKIYTASIQQRKRPLPQRVSQVKNTHKTTKLKTLDEGANQLTHRWS